MSDASVKDLLQRFEVGEQLTRGVLLVDDEQPNLDVLGSFLEADYDIYTATSGAEALRIAASTPIDVVITDQRMPAMTGIELLEHLRLIKPDVAGIVLTAYTDTSALISAINQAQVFRFLKKPWQAEEVFEALAQASRSVYQERAIQHLVERLASRTDELAKTLEELRAAQQGMLHLERLVITGRLAAGITHDLRNAMTGLIFLDNEVQQRDVDPEFAECVTVGVAGVRNLLGSLETMNQFVREKRLSMAMEWFDPARIVLDAAAVMRMDLNYRKRNVQVDAVEGVLPKILGDRQKLVQVMVNLIRNAIQATQDKQTVAISAGRSADGEVLLAVEDEGPGVPAEVQARLFEAFQSTKGEQGMGMGLYMSRMIVRHHSGQIACVDRAGGGARFEVKVPVAPSGPPS